MESLLFFIANLRRKNFDFVKESLLLLQHSIYLGETKLFLTLCTDNICDILLIVGLIN